VRLTAEQDISVLQWCRVFKYFTTIYIYEYDVKENFCFSCYLPWQVARHCNNLYSMDSYKSAQ